MTGTPPGAPSVTGEGARLLAAIATRLHPESQDLADRLTERILADEPELRGSPQAQEFLRASVSSNIVIALEVFARGLDVAELDAPADALGYARRVAQHGTPITALLRAYRIGQRVFHDHMIERIKSATHDPLSVAEAAAELADRSFAYVDTVSAQVVSAYQDERDRWLTNKMAVRTARVKSILAGRPSELRDTENTIGYLLDRPHLGMIAWAEGGADPLRALKQLVTDIADQVRCQGQPLVILVDESTLWVWFPNPAASVTEHAATTSQAVWAAVGKVENGLSGFRRTHTQALQARTVATAAGGRPRSTVTRYSQTSVIALLCADIAATRAWIGEILGPLAGDDDADAQLRETLRVFLDTNGSYVATAKRMMVHRNTVQYRINKAESVLGRSLRADRLDLEVALHACRWLGSPVSDHDIST
jgi:DNA-binding PucR family transcriptional regulator